MKISEASARSGLNIDTIRYYERSGLLPTIGRGSDGVRRFSAENVEWLVLLASLRRTGMPMKKVHAFSKLYQHGNEEIPARRQMLVEHSFELDRRRQEIDKCAELLAHKLQIYAEIEGKI